METRSEAEEHAIEKVAILLYGVRTELIHVAYNLSPEKIDNRRYIFWSEIIYDVECIVTMMLFEQPNLLEDKLKEDAKHDDRLTRILNEFSSSTKKKLANVLEHIHEPKQNRDHQVKSRRSDLNKFTIPCQIGLRSSDVTTQGGTHG